MSKEFNTLWGDFSADEVEKTPEEDENIEEKNEDSKNPENVEEVDKDNLDTKDDKKAEVDPDEDKEKDEVKKGEDEDITDTEEIFNSVNDLLEKEELIFIGEEDQYDATSEGLAKMMRDNMEKYKAKMEADFAKREEAIHTSYKESSKPKFSNMDVENEKQAEFMLTEYYKQTGLEEEEIEDKLKELKDLDNVSKEAKIAKRYLSKIEVKEEEKRKNDAAKAEEERASQIEEYINSIKSTIDNTEEMAGFAFTNKIRKDFKSYLFDEDKDGKTQAQKAGTDPERRLKLAFLDFMEFNKKDFEIKAKTEVSNELKKKNSRFTSKNSKAKGKQIDIEPEQEGFNKNFLSFWGQ